MVPEKITVKVKRITQEFDDIELPGYTTPGSAGMDVRAAVKDEVILRAGEVSLIPTNLVFEIPEGFEIQVRPRSGLAVKHGIGILNSPGTIDSDYRGEVKIILMNFSKEDFVIKRGDRIAQLVLSGIYRANFEENTSLAKTKRGEGGFGHTGKG